MTTIDTRGNLHDGLGQFTDKAHPSAGYDLSVSDGADRLVNALRRVVSDYDDYQADLARRNPSGATPTPEPAAPPTETVWTARIEEARTALGSAPEDSRTHAYLVAQIRNLELNEAVEQVQSDPENPAAHAWLNEVMAQHEVSATERLARMHLPADRVTDTDGSGFRCHPAALLDDRSAARELRRFAAHIADTEPRSAANARAAADRIAPVPPHPLTPYQMREAGAALRDRKATPLARMRAAFPDVDDYADSTPLTTLLAQHGVPHRHDDDPDNAVTVDGIEDALHGEGGLDRSLDNLTVGDLRAEATFAATVVGQTGYDMPREVNVHALIGKHLQALGKARLKAIKRTHECAPVGDVGDTVTCAVCGKRWQGYEDPDNQFRKHLMAPTAWQRRRFGR